MKTGLERFLETPPRSISGMRIGLLCNPASVAGGCIHASALTAKRFPGKLTALFSPQHGYFAEKQDNMIESDHMADPILKIPVFSLYGKTRIPTRDMYDRIDTLVVDLQDAGTRVYTFIYTVSYCMEAAKKFGKKVIVLDRPNPLGGEDVEGGVLSQEYASFVGRYPIPMRHGLTIGELATLFNDRFGIGCDLEVVPMQGWKRNMHFADTGLPWVAPSPNLPTPSSATVYPGQVLLEGTNLSEGRGTTQPFELFGAPFVDWKKILETPGVKEIPGAVLRPCAFEPAFNKWQGLMCRGFQIHVTDPRRYKPYATTLKLLHTIYRHHKDRFEWKRPPYEYEFEKMPIDLITGNTTVRTGIENGADIEEMEESWRKETDEFREISRAYHLYS